MNLFLNIYWLMIKSKTVIGDNTDHEKEPCAHWKLENAYHKDETVKKGDSRSWQLPLNRSPSG